MCKEFWEWSYEYLETLPDLFIKTNKRQNPLFKNNCLMSSSTRTNHRRLKKKLKIGDFITWGKGITSHKVIQIKGDGVIVDVSDDPKASKYTNLKINNNLCYFVDFANHGESNIRIVGDK